MPRLTQPLRAPSLRPTDRPPFWWLRWVPASVFAAILIYLLYVVGRVAIIPVLASLALAYVLSPMVLSLQKRGISRALSAFLVLLFVTLCAGLFLWFVIPDLWREAASAGDIIFRNFNEANAVKVRAEIRELSPLLDRIIGYRVYQAMRNPNAVLDVSRTWAAGSLTNFIATATAWLDMLLVPFFVYYILVDFQKWRDSFDELIPPRFREPFARLFDEVGRILQSYVLGQLLIAVIMAVLYAIGFAILKVPAWAGLAALSGFLNVIPYIGTLTGVVLASGFTFAQGNGIWAVLGVIGVFILVQTIEGYYLTPRILGGRLSLHPMAVFLGLLIGGRLFGILGILLAVPVIAVGHVFLKFLRELYRGSYFYHAGEVDPAEPQPDAMPEMIAKAADTVLSEQVDQQSGDELLAPETDKDDPAAQERVPHGIRS